MENNYASQNLVKLRKKFGFSTEEVAGILKISVEEYLKYEYGTETPTINELNKLGLVYSVNPSDILNVLL